MPEHKKGKALPVDYSGNALKLTLSKGFCMNIHDKSNRNKQKAQPERHSRQARSVQIADHHPTGIRLPSDYPVLPPAANLFIIAGVKVRHGAVAGRLLMGGRA